MLISLDNLQREVDRDGDVQHISRFVDAMLASVALPESPMAGKQLYWCLEPNDYMESADFRSPLSDRVDRVLVHLSLDGQLISWVTPEILKTLGLSEPDASSKAFTNLATALEEATVEFQTLHGVQLGYIGTRIPFKASLILAPNLKDIVGAKLGWPLMAVTPDRDFLYLWAARHKDFVARVGPVVVSEYTKASYPISTEVWEITDAGMRAIGKFPTGP